MDLSKHPLIEQLRDICERVDALPNIPEKEELKVRSTRAYEYALTTIARYEKKTDGLYQIASELDTMKDGIEQSRLEGNGSTGDDFLDRVLKRLGF